ncbi:nucleotidyltransferase domain-containing protein [Candidatus Woesearchaeota archaeon]|jgi:predicted nucleotidyltransferase|nr:nucleotidyltransferase domain-containing protein [Candidatus Woesearchaeota archaeon]
MIIKKILSQFVINPSKKWTIRELSLKTTINYRQVYEAIHKLILDGVITYEKVGASKQCAIDISKNEKIFSEVENFRTNQIISKNSSIKLISKLIKELNSCFFICILFGSYANHTQTKKSDLDLLFIIPDLENDENFKKQIKQKLSVLPDKLDINVVQENWYLDMISKPNKYNLANEIIKNHVILFGSEQYYLLFQKNILKGN